MSSQVFIMVLMSGRGAGLELQAKGEETRFASVKHGRLTLTHIKIHQHRSSVHHLYLILRRCQAAHREEGYAHIQTFPYTHMHMQGNRRARSGWQAQQCPLQTAISMEIVLIVPADHTGSARQAGCESVKPSESRDSLYVLLSRSRPY